MHQNRISDEMRVHGGIAGPTVRGKSIRCMLDSCAQSVNSKKKAMGRPMLTETYKINVDARASTLYELAKEKTWNVSKDLNWMGRTQGSPLGEDVSPFRKFAPYVAMSREDRDRADLLCHAWEISEILHGEQGALLISSQLVQLLPPMEAKLFASSQVFDEARHVEFFSKYLETHVGTICPISVEIRDLIEGALADESIDKKLITMQIVIESLAMAKFQRLKRFTVVPVLHAALDYIIKDEARHVGFGVELMRKRVAVLPKTVRDDYAFLALEAVSKLANTLNAPTNVADAFGWNKTELRRHLRERRIADPDEAKAVFRQLQVNLNSVGLLTDALKEKLGTRGLYVEC